MKQKLRFEVQTEVSVGIRAFWDTPLCGLTCTDSKEHAASNIKAQRKHIWLITLTLRNVTCVGLRFIFIYEIWGLGRDDYKGSKCLVFRRYRILSNLL
jgi:hypothetical protein